MENWDPENRGWLGCPHCKPELGEIELLADVQGDLSAFIMFNRSPTVARAGRYMATFNQHGAACVVAENSRTLGIKPGEFLWLSPVPPYDRWCKGNGGLHK